VSETWINVDQLRETEGLGGGTSIATCDVVTRVITVTPPLEGSDGGLITGTTVDAWGEDETGMERADDGLILIELTRITDWARDPLSDQSWAAWVEVESGRPQD